MALPRPPAPALLPSAGFVAGAALAFAAGAFPLGLAVALGGLGLALAPPWRGPLLGFALGLLWPLTRGEVPPRGAVFVDPSRPVEIVGEVEGHWRRTAFGWSVALRIESLRQGRQRPWFSREVEVRVAGEEAPPGLGHRLALRGSLHRSAGFWNRRPRPPSDWRMTVKSRRLLQVIAEPDGFHRLSGRLRGRVEHAFSQAPDTPGKALARALVLGDASTLGEGTKRGLRRLGLSHLLSVSGLHIAAVAGFALALGCRLARQARVGLSLTAVAGYALLVGPQPAVQRAVLMATLALLAGTLRRPPSPANALALAGAGLVAVTPSLVLDLGFQLTMAATAGLIFLAPLLARRFEGLPPGLGRGLAATVAAQLATLPFSLPVFHLLTPLAPVANLLAVPWAALALAVDLLWSLVAMVSPAAAAAVSPALDGVAAPFLWAAEWRGGVPLAIPLALGPVAAALLATGILGALLHLRAWLVAPLALGALLLMGSPPDLPTELVVLDVGQGDSILLKDGPHALLVDGGGWENGDIASAVLLPALLGEGVRRLDAVILTHGDLDHCGGLLQLADYLPIAEIWTGPGLGPGGCAAALASLDSSLQQKLSAGDERRLGRWRLHVLHPDTGAPVTDNDGSLVLLAEAADRRFLLTGDVEAGGERQMVERYGSGLAADVLKVAHHGSRTSTTAPFLAAVHPRLALVSVGRQNRYRHPSREVLARLERAGAEVLRTDLEGCSRVRVTTRGSLRVEVCGPR